MHSKNYFHEVTKFIAPNLYCGTNKFTIKLMYDGTMITCQNNIFDKDINYITAIDDNAMTIKKAWITHHHFINPFVDDDETIFNNLDMFSTMQTDGWRFLLEHYIITMYYLSLAGQIDPKYSKDEYILVKHALMLLKYNQCQYNNYIETGSAYCRGNGFFRMFFNGYADLLEDEYNRQILQKQKYPGTRSLLDRETRAVCE